MAGLLDLFSGDAGLLTGLALMDAGSAKPVRTSTAGGLLGALTNTQQMLQAQEDRKLKQRMTALQEQQLMQALALQKQQQDEAARARANENEFRRLIPSPQMQSNMDALAGGGGPTQANAARVQPVDPLAQLTHEAMRLGQIKPTDYLASLRKEEAPLVVGEGAAVLKGGKPIFTNQKTEAMPPSVREFNYAQGNPAFMQFLREQANLKAPKTDIRINAEKPLINTVANKLGEQIDASLANAKAARQAIDTAQSIKSAIDTGKVIAGPGSTFRVVGLQLGQMLGVGGADAAQVLSNTRTVIQGLAKAELDTAQQMKGQGQITEAERDIIRRAASGNIDTMTGPEIRLLMDGMEKTARSKISQHRSNVDALSKIDGAAPLIPFYQVDEPPTDSGGWSIRPKPQGGR